MSNADGMKSVLQLLCRRLHCFLQESSPVQNVSVLPDFLMDSQTMEQEQEVKFPAEEDLMTSN